VGVKKKEDSRKRTAKERNPFWFVSHQKTPKHKKRKTLKKRGQKNWAKSSARFLKKLVRRREGLG